MLNLRQLHLIQSELFDELDFHGEDSVRIQPGRMGQNVTTSVIDLLALSKGTKLRFGERRIRRLSLKVGTRVPLIGVCPFASSISSLAYYWRLCL